MASGESVGDWVNNDYIIYGENQNLCVLCFFCRYNLTITAGNSLQLNSEPVTATVLRYVPGAQILSQSAGEMSFQLPLEAVSRFGELFAEIDKRLDEFGVGGYGAAAMIACVYPSQGVSLWAPVLTPLLSLAGVSITTLEEVFIRIAQGESDRVARREVEAAAEALSEATVNLDQSGIVLEEMSGPPGGMSGPDVGAGGSPGLQEDLRISTGVPQSDVLPEDWVGSMSMPW